MVTCALIFNAKMLAAINQNSKVVVQRRRVKDEGFVGALVKVLGLNAKVEMTIGMQPRVTSEDFNFRLDGNLCSDLQRQNAGCYQSEFQGCGAAQACKRRGIRWRPCQGPWS